MVDQVELVERVAEAIHAAAQVSWDRHKVRDDWFSQARAALEASHHAELVEALGLYRRPEDPTQRADDVAYAMREYYEANRPLRWWEKRNPPGTWGCIADELMLGLRAIVLDAEQKYRAATPNVGGLSHTGVDHG